MRFLWAAVKKDLIRMRRDPSALLAALGIPLILVVLITLVFGGGQAAPQGRLLVADEDQSVLSQILISAFNREPLSKMLVTETIARDEGQRRMDQGDASALLIVPKGFQTDFLKNQPVQLQLVTNPAQQILPKIIEQFVSTAVDGGFYLQREAAIPLRTIATIRQPTDDAIADSTIADNTVAQVSVAFSRLGRSLSRYLNPSLIGLDLHVTADAQQRQGIGAIFLPAMIFMGLLLIANWHSLDIWTEQSWGTLRRLCTTPASLGAFLAGRLISLAVLFCGVAIAGVAGMRWFAQVQVASAPMAIAWLVICGAAFYLLFATILVNAPNQRTASVVGNLIVFPLALIGGSFFPFEMMPDWMVRIGRFTPNGWAVTEFKAIVNGSAHAKEFVAGTAYMAAGGCVLFLLIVNRMRRKLI